VTLPPVSSVVFISSMPGPPFALSAPDPLSVRNPTPVLEAS
jgi:hypothetical protein